NIAILNVTIVDIIPGKAPPFGGPVLIGNVLDEQHAFNIRLEVPYSDNPHTPNITEEAEVRLKFDQQGWNILEQSGQLENEGIRIVGYREILITQPHVLLTNVVFPPDTRIPIDVQFNFLTEEITENRQYQFAISQAFADTPSVVLGTET